jgi:hypothetical protein
MDMSITLGDVIGYVIAFVFGILAGIGGDRLFIKINSSNKSKITQSKNTIGTGDIIAGNKND